jgi:hypothetical protein
MAIVVDEPIINGPFSEPTRHCRMRSGQVRVTLPPGGSIERLLPCVVLDSFYYREGS